MAVRELSRTPDHRSAGRLRGHVAFITGASSGVGLEVARIFYDEGARVVATSLSEDKLHRELKESSRMHVRQLDVTDEAACAAAVADAHAHFGEYPDILVNNAGATIRATIDETTTDLFASTIELNVGSAVRLIRLLAPSMRDRERGSIINVSSITATEGQSGVVAYTASKGAMNAATRSLAVELAPSGVRVNTISPTVIDTPMTHNHVHTVEDRDTRYDALLGRQPLGRMASARDVALAALYLASDDSSFITGINLPVDGGRSAGK